MGSGLSVKRGSSGEAMGDRTESVRGGERMRLKDVGTFFLKYRGKMSTPLLKPPPLKQVPPFSVPYVRHTRPRSSKPPNWIWTTPSSPSLGWSTSAGPTPSVQCGGGLMGEGVRPTVGPHWAGGGPWHSRKGKGPRHFGVGKEEKEKI